jgi:rare lipoprotein A
MDFTSTGLLLFYPMIRSLLVIGLSLSFFLFLGCSKQVVRPPLESQTVSPPVIPKSPAEVPKKAERKERPYAVKDKWYFPVSSVAEYKEKGICSWYGPDFHGKQTSSGETYDMFGYTAAHRILPYNTQVRVKNPANNKEILVRINDRGPFLKDRILDLSYSGAKALDLLGPGTGLIELEALGILEESEENGQKITRLVQKVDFRIGEFSVQIGAFKDRQNALRLQEKLINQYAQIEVSETVRLGETFFRVRVCRCTRLEEALSLQKQLEGKGFTPIFVVAQ